MQNKKLKETVDRLIEEGKAVLSTKKPSSSSSYVDGKVFAKWLVGCRLLIHSLGEHTKSFEESFRQTAEYYEFFRAERMQATLLAIREAIQHGLLAKIEDLVSAEIFDSLLEQAEYLLDQNFFLAAGVLGRAVLEERLRTMCRSAGCAPEKQKPTLSDFNMALYKATAYNVSVMKHVESMAATGNDAAHNKPELTKEDAARLLRDLREFLGKYSG